VIVVERWDVGKMKVGMQKFQGERERTKEPIRPQQLYYGSK